MSTWAPLPMPWSTDAKFGAEQLSVLHYVITRLGCLPMRKDQYLCMLNVLSASINRSIEKGIRSWFVGFKDVNFQLGPLPVPSPDLWRLKLQSPLRRSALHWPPKGHCFTCPWFWPINWGFSNKKVFKLNGSSAILVCTLSTRPSRVRLMLYRAPLSTSLTYRLAASITELL